jgi:hypothetical protein
LQTSRWSKPDRSAAKRCARLHVAASILTSLLTLKRALDPFPRHVARKIDHSGCIAARIIERDHQEGTVKTPDTP